LLRSATAHPGPERILGISKQNLRLASVTCLRCLLSFPKFFFFIIHSTALRSAKEDLLRSRSQPVENKLPLLFFRVPARLHHCPLVIPPSCTFPSFQRPFVSLLNAFAGHILAGDSKISNHVSITVHQEPHPSRFVPSSPTPLPK
jgi:hypothetical protein